MIGNKNNMPNVVSFIKNNYYLYNNYMGWHIYKKLDKYFLDITFT